ncbi:hypothetical protein [Niallia endozanthoxylica]|uniref:hypothetical protein n=1 Tax=Niallia endozanthoxylica TaxID=2036016 RepID=UPI001CC74B7D|nr:hypothetical protein [Niallia endozanthoxylica]
MNKKLWVSVLILVIVIGGFYSFMKFNPPLEISTLASSENHKSVVVGLAIKGFVK